MHREPLDGNISLAQLEAVIAIVDFGSFTAAADVLGISQPSLSRRISALERTLGLPVFRPVGREMVLTEIGRSILPAGRRALREVASIGSIASSTLALTTGCLRIAGLPSLVGGIMPDYLGPFHRNHPGIRIEILSVEDNEQLVEALRLNRADVAFGVNRHIPADLIGVPLRDQQFAAVVSQECPVDNDTVIDASALESLSLVTLPQGTSIRQVTDDVYRHFKVVAPRVITTTQRDALVPLSIATGGITMVPDVLGATAEIFGGRQLPLHFSAGRPLGAIYRRDEQRNPALTEFLEHL
ncbi:LysR family transcriptional regulator [Glutamicibacter sp. PS]|uniref:LysR family transcriptional regulator n=1 Tax=Glutamicibacter sp. PS TaxID=3075634 RepID=UPI00284E1389|nr:LysR family transcriptional regulator [Glutamicibacter sp. PS]MDR4533991.1 LysR family transcriptional regulator [Glutamicibacter sp. PS]